MTIEDETNVFEIEKYTIEYLKTPEGLIAFREFAELTQHELADLCSIRQQNLASMETGRRKITEKSAKRIHEALIFYLKEPTTEEREQSRRRARKAVDAVFAAANISWNE